MRSKHHRWGWGNGAPASNRDHDRDPSPGPDPKSNPSPDVDPNPIIHVFLPICLPRTITRDVLRCYIQLEAILNLVTA